MIRDQLIRGSVEIETDGGLTTLDIRVSSCDEYSSWHLQTGLVGPIISNPKHGVCTHTTMPTHTTQTSHINTYRAPIVTDLFTSM